MKDVLQYILINIVDHPDDVEVEESNDGDRIILTIKANSEDNGKIIGKQGRIIRAIRELTKVIAAKNNSYVEIVLAD